MKFKANTRRRALEYEKDLVQYWKENKTFEKSIELRPKENSYVFYDGPPFISGIPHHGTLLSSVVKDAVPRYQTMKGKRVERVWGWDAHGLPAERYTEKKLGITSRQEVIEYGIEKYILATRANMLETSSAWEDTIDRIGRWVDFKGAYKTMDKDYMESIWWAFKTLYEKGKIYEGEKVLMYCTLDATPLSKAEVTMDAGAYQDVTDPSVYTKFKLSVAPTGHRVPNYEFTDEYIMYDVTEQVSLFDLPKTINGLHLKNDEFHLSLLKVPEGTIDAVKREKIESISKSTGLSLKTGPRLTGEFLHLVDESRDRESIVALMEWGELEKWQNAIREIMPDADFVIPHTTLYTRETGPIGFSEKTRHLSKQPDKSILDILQKAVRTTRRPENLLAWTTTPWTLPANTALAVNPDITYAEIRLSSPFKNVFLISGKHAIASDEYYPNLKRTLESDGYNVTIVDHVNAAAPSLQENLEQLNAYDFENAHVVTHSLGAATFLKWLDGNDTKIASLTMIAPSYPGGEPGSSNDDWKQKSGYVGFSVDFENVRRRIQSQPTILYSDDLPVRNEGFEKLGTSLQANMVYESNKGHFFEKEETRQPDFTIDFSESYIVAKELAEKVFTNEKHQQLDFTITREFSGDELVGRTYEPLFGDRGENAQKIWAADYVTTESGTGIVHIAPAYGEEDFALAREKNIPVVHVLDENGEYTETEWKGENVWAINKTIAKTLVERGVVWKIDYFRHSYPHCHRCGTKLMYRAHPSWFMDIDSQRTQMLEQNGDINWFPEHVKHGRFEKTVETAPDWNISRDRFWATAMPVWKGTDSDGVEHVKVIGSYAELKELSGVELDDYHRPWIDDVTFEIDGVTYTRIDKVMDSWFEAGSMPFAQFHYPFENKQKFEENFPGDFIVEYIGQVRAWFYYMHAMSVALFGENSFKNVVVTGNVAGNDGRKMSKSYGNYTDPNELMDKFSADSLRFLLLSSPLLSGEDFALQDKEVGDVARKLSMVWNMYDFFTMYADVDGWEYDGELCDPSERIENPLDIWIVSRVHQLIQEIEQHMDVYDIPNAMKPILPFIDDASNWFVRRSRRRFWKSDDTADKENAYVTLHYVLVRLSQALAPFTPFLAEELFRSLTGEESVHLTDWPEVGHVNELVVRDMETVRDYVNQALSLRAAAKLKIRQPLTSVTIPAAGEFVDFEDVLIDELNVKKVIVGGELAIDTELTPELVREGVSREIIRYIQAARKNAGLNVDDRITLFFATTNPAEDIFESFKTHNAQIMSETLAVAMSDTKLAYTDTVTIDGEEVVISLEKA